MPDNQTTDLVTRLRSEGQPEDPYNSVGTMGFAQGARSSLMREAASEIERLRAEVDSLKREHALSEMAHEARRLNLP